MELWWHIHEFMWNRMTLHHVLKMAAALHYRHSWTLCSMLSTICCRTSLSMLASTSRICFSRLLHCEVCTCTLSPPGSPKERNMEMTSLEIGGPQVLSKDCLAVKQKLTWWKHVPLSTTCWGHNSDMNRQCFCSKFHLLLIIFSRITDKNKLGIPFESPYTRGNNIGSVFEATWSKISVTFSILTVYS